MIYNFGINDVPGDSKSSSVGYRSYDLWHGMIRRCVNSTDSIRNASYEKTTICEEWRYYSKFKQWYNDNYIEGYQLDKDVIGGSKNHYSPETCAFVPPLINSCIIDGNRGKGDTPLGVSYVSDPKSIKKYRPVISKFCKPIRNFGVKETAMEAHRIWQCEKASYLQELIDIYRNDVSPNVVIGLKRRIDILNEDIKNFKETKTISKI